MPRALAGRLVDLSHPLFPGKEEYHLDLDTHFTDELYPQYKRSPDTWYILQDVRMSSHCGTHIEFPYHHCRTGMDAAAFPLERLVGDAVLLDFRHKAPGDAVDRSELEALEARIRPGDMVLFNFNCARFYRTPRSHDRPRSPTRPSGGSPSSSRISLIGSDASGIELKGVPDQPNHQLLMDNGIPIIEFAANLDGLPGERFTLFVLALSVAGPGLVPRAPARAGGRTRMARRRRHVDKPAAAGHVTGALSTGRWCRSAGSRRSSTTFSPPGTCRGACTSTTARRRWRSGVCAHLSRADYITSTHRGHGHCIAKGADIRAVMAEMFAKSTGCCRGMGGSMHIADFSVGMLGANGIVAGGHPHRSRARG